MSKRIVISGAYLDSFTNCANYPATVTILAASGTFVNFETISTNCGSTRKVSSHNLTGITSVRFVGGGFDVDVPFSQVLNYLWLGTPGVTFSDVQQQIQYDCINGACIPKSTYNTPGIYANLSACETACGTGCSGKCISNSDWAQIEGLANQLKNQNCS